MSDVRNCRKCGKVFSYLGGMPLCPACKGKDEEDFKRVKDYLYENPRSTLSEVSNALDMSVEKIKRFLRDGRLEIVGEEGNMVLECENCGKAIKSGKYCEFCEKELASGFKTAATDMKNTLSQSMQGNKGLGIRYLSKDEYKNKGQNR